MGGAFSVDGGETWCEPVEVSWTAPGWDPSPADDAELARLWGGCGMSFRVELAPAAAELLASVGEDARGRVCDAAAGAAWARAMDYLDRSVLEGRPRMPTAPAAPAAVWRPLSWRDLSPLSEYRYPRL